MLYPRQCERCGVILKHRSSFSRHKKLNNCHRSSEIENTVHDFFSTNDKNISQHDAQRIFPLVQQLQQLSITSSALLMQEIDKVDTTSAQILDACHVSMEDLVRYINELVDEGIIPEATEATVNMADVVFHTWRYIFTPHATGAHFVRHLCRRAMRPDALRGDAFCQIREMITVNAAGELYTYAHHLALHDNVDNDAVFLAFTQMTHKTETWVSREWVSTLSKQYKDIRDMVVQVCDDGTQFVFSAMVPQLVPTETDIRKMKKTYMKDNAAPLLQGWHLVRNLLDR